MQLRDNIRLIKRYWGLLVLAALMGAGAGTLLSTLQTPTYSASTRVFVSAQPGETPADLTEGSNYTLARVASYATLVDSQRVLDGAIASLGLSENYWTVAERIRASIVPETTVIEISAESDTPQGAVALADATAASLSETVAAIESAPGAESPVQLAIVQQARTPEKPVHPVLAVYVALGAALALVAAAAFVLIREALDMRIHGERDINAVTDAPILATIAVDSKSKQRPLVVHADPLSARAESYRVLRTSLQFIELKGRSRTFVITSPAAGAGKSTTIANLALALADAGQRVILVDADLRQPKLAKYMGIEGAVGLTDVLTGNAALGDVIQPWLDTSLSVLAAGRIPPNPSELLGSKVMVALIAQLEADFEYVLFDSPPLLPVADAVVLSEHVSEVIVVVSAGRTTKHHLAMAARRLRSVGSQVGGVVLTMVPARGAETYDYGRDRAVAASLTPRPTSTP